MSHCRAIDVFLKWMFLSRVRGWMDGWFLDPFPTLENPLDLSPSVNKTSVLQNDLHILQYILLARK